MATNDQTRRVEFPNVPPRINAPGAPKAPGKPMPKKGGDDAKWMAGLAAVMGLGLGGGIAYAAGTFDGNDGPTDAELAAAEAKVDAAAEANEAAQQVEPAPVQEKVVEVHHVHHHDHAPNVVAPTEPQADIEVRFYERISDTDGNYMDRCDIKVGDQEASLFDTDGDGIADVLRIDVNGDGEYAGENEIVNLHEAGYEIPMREFAQEIGFDYDNPVGAYADATGYQVVDEFTVNNLDDMYADNGDIDDNNGQFVDGEPDYTVDVDDDDIVVSDDEVLVSNDDDSIFADSGDNDIVLADDEVELMGNQELAVDDVMVVDMEETPLEEELMAMDDTQDFDNSGELELTDEAPADDLMADNSLAPEEPVDDVSFDAGMV